MIDKLEQSKQSGIFTISPCKDVYGELTLAGQNTSLYLRDKEFFNTRTIPGQYVTGILHNLTKVTLIHCITKSSEEYTHRGNDKYHSARIFPHYVVHGDSHIDPDAKTITEVHFVVDDASTLFYDFDAFGSLIDARPFIEQIVRANGLEREISIGPDPRILYFTGKREIFSAKTILGRISASHNPSHDMGSPNGVSMKNTIFVTISFQVTVAFKEAIAHTSTLLKYFAILVGRPQNLLKLNLRINCKEERPNFLQVYWSMPPQREPSHEERSPHPSDVLLDAVQQPDVFSRVLENWLERQSVWHDARQRFSHSFARQQYYSIDRLIGAANMFDILPSSVIPRDVQLSDELLQAKEKCQEIFLGLPPSAERDSVLNAFGRLGKSALKHKIRHRGQLLINLLGGKFKDLFIVINEAVNCRNHYVHGSDPRFDYTNNFDAVIFLTNTLEFVFAASDLIEAGWDITSWSNQHTAMSHPFAEYRVSYAENLRALQALLTQQAVS